MAISGTFPLVLGRQFVLLLEDRTIESALLTSDLADSGQNRTRPSRLSFHSIFSTLESRVSISTVQRPIHPSIALARQHRSDSHQKVNEIRRKFRARSGDRQDEVNHHPEVISRH
jgi:hypothetical protein